MNFRRRDIFLKIEPLLSYSPLAPVACARHFGRDCMFNPGHDSGRIPAREILATTADGLVYREYLDSHYTVPNKAKLIDADVNEPPWDRRIPGCVLYAKPGERLYIHVLNGDANECHSFHIHGLRFGIESDGAWPLGVARRDGRRSDEILPGQKWTYVYDVTPDMVGVWGFHDHAHDVARNVNLGLFGGLIVRNPIAPCADHEVPIFVHQFAGSSGFAFQSKRLTKNETFSFHFTDETVVNYYCAIHGPTMNGTVQVVPDGPPSASVSIQDNKFVPPLVLVQPGGTVDWRNEGNHEHTVFSAGGAAPSFCLNGRAFVGNTPTIVGETGERVRWYIFNLDVSGIWHNFHPHSVRWALPTAPGGQGGASDVHGLSSLETFVTDTEVPPAMRLPHALEQFQWDPPENACHVRIRGDFLFHCHIEEHMMAGLAGLVRACQHIWISDELSEMCEMELPFDDGMNDCPHVDMLRCLRDHNKPSPSGHVHSAPVVDQSGADQPEAAEETSMMGDVDVEGGAAMGMGGAGMMTGMAGMTGMGGMHGMAGGAAMRTVLSPEILEAATKGLWELLPCPAPILAVHGAVLHTGKILLFAGSGNDELFTTGLRSAVWDYENGEFVCPFTPVDFFCAGQTFLADGRLLVAGGTKEYDNSEQPFIGLDTSYLFDPLSESWIRVASMAEGRWYPTLVTLGDGRVFNVSGGPNRAEVYSSVGGWVQMPTQEEWPLFPHLFLTRDGRLFYDGGNMFPNPRAPQPGFLDISTSTMTSVTLPEGFSQNRDHCGSVLLAPAQEQRFLIMGGGDPAINSAHIIDLKAAEPAFEEVAPMIHARFHINAVLLPDRTVFVSGGNGQSEIAATAVLEAEIYDPAKNTWIAAATAQAARMYHSIALLLPDGRVLAAGSNPNRRDDELRLEIYHPPYLFRGPRPFIETVPQQILYGGDFEIHTPHANEIQWVELIWPMATTHSLETGQRVVDLEFEAHDFCHLHVKVLTEQNIAPPGWYMLFLVNKQGVPSVAKWVQLTGGEKPGHEPAEIKQRLDMRVTSKDRPVPGSKGLNY